jgi:hypothetical protein
MFKPSLQSRIDKSQVAQCSLHSSMHYREEVGMLVLSSIAFALSVESITTNHTAPRTTARQHNYETWNYIFGSPQRTTRPLMPTPPPHSSTYSIVVPSPGRYHPPWRLYIVQGSVNNPVSLRCLDKSIILDNAPNQPSQELESYRLSFLPVCRPGWTVLSI